MTRPILTSENTGPRRENRVTGKVAPSRTAAIGGTRVALIAGLRLAIIDVRQSDVNILGVSRRSPLNAAQRSAVPDARLPHHLAELARIERMHYSGLLAQDQ